MSGLCPGRYRNKSSSVPAIALLRDRDRYMQVQSAFELPVKLQFRGVVQTRVERKAVGQPANLLQHQAGAERKQVLRADAGAEEEPKRILHRANTDLEVAPEGGLLPRVRRDVQHDARCIARQLSVLLLDF